MPLCICPPEEEPAAEEGKQEAAAPKSLAKELAAKPKPVKKFGGFRSYGKKSYDLHGNLNEQCRDAIKNKDVPGVRQLLEAKADANYVDKTGATLGHMAALFNASEIMMILIENGANVWVSGSTSETAVQVAPPALAARMKAKQPKEWVDKHSA
jgi:ankyrin repeat protein